MNVKSSSYVIKFKRLTFTKDSSQKTIKNWW